MSRSVLYMSMSLDGFIAGPADDPGRGPGIDGERLHAWLGDSADLAQSCLRAGVLDELELIRIVDAPGVVHLRYQVTS